MSVALRVSHSAVDVVDSAEVWTCKKGDSTILHAGAYDVCDGCAASAVLPHAVSMQCPNSYVQYRSGNVMPAICLSRLYTGKILQRPSKLLTIQISACAPKEPYLIDQTQRHG